MHPAKVSAMSTKPVPERNKNYYIGNLLITGRELLSSSTASQSTSQIKVRNSRPFSGKSSAPCWEPLLACAQVSTSQMAKVKGRIKIHPTSKNKDVIQLLVFVPKASWD